MGFGNWEPYTGPWAGHWDTPFGRMLGERLGIGPGGVNPVTHPAETVTGEEGGRNRAQQLTDIIQGFDPAQWYASPGVTIRDDQVWLETPGGAEYTPGTAEIPEWAGLDFQNPQIFYDWYQSAKDLPDFPAQLAGLGSRATSEQMETDARERAIANLLGGRELYQTELEGYRTDPERQTVISELLRRSSPEYQTIGPLQQTELLNQLAQGLARTTGRTTASAAGRGSVMSGTTLQQLAGQRAMGNLGELQLRAGVETENERARARALGALGQTQDVEGQMELAYMRELATIDARIAALEAGLEVEPSDFMPFQELGFQREQMDWARQFAERELESYDEASQWGPEDRRRLFLSSIGGGFWDWLF